MIDSLPLQLSENRLRHAAIEFFESDEGLKYIRDIHLTLFQTWTCQVMGLTNKDIRAQVKNRVRATPELVARYRRATREAQIIQAQVVMANTMVLYQGESSPALVVVASGPGAYEAMTVAGPALAEAHFGVPSNMQQEQLAEMIEDETYTFGKRRRLPSWLVGDVEAYAADLWVPGAAAHEDGLRSNILPCFAEPGLNGLTFAIPAQLVNEARVKRVAVPPPVPR